MNKKFVTKCSSERLQNSINYYEKHFKDIKIINIGVSLSQVQGIASVYWMVLEHGDSIQAKALDKETIIPATTMPIPEHIIADVDAEINRQNDDYEAEAARLLRS